MPRSEGFSVMDVSTDIVNDPKFRKLQRSDPELVGDAFTVYVATLAESWKAGQRVPADEVWPTILPYRESVLTALREAGCLDGRNLINQKSWKSWFGPANDRRKKSRDRWRRYNETRELSGKSDAATTSLPRGTNVATATSVPSRTEPFRPDPVRPSDTRLDIPDGRADIEAFVLLKRAAPTPRQRQLLDGVLERHDLTGPQWAADLMYRHPDDPIGAVIEADRAYRAERIATAQAQERPKPIPRRRGSGLTGINAELAAMFREQEAKESA